MWASISRAASWGVRAAAVAPAPGRTSCSGSTVCLAVRSLLDQCHTSPPLRITAVSAPSARSATRDFSSPDCQTLIVCVPDASAATSESPSGRAGRPRSARVWTVPENVSTFEFWRSTRSCSAVSGGNAGSATARGAMAAKPTAATATAGTAQRINGCLEVTAMRNSLGCRASGCGHLRQPASPAAAWPRRIPRPDAEGRGSSANRPDGPDRARSRCPRR